MAAIIPIVNAASTVVGLLLDSLAAAQRYSAVIQAANAAGRPISVDDLKAARAADGTVDAALEAAIVAHGG